MPIWIPVTSGVINLLCAIAFGVIADKNRRGTLPRNSMIGIRLASTMRSDEAWGKAHRRTWMGSALIAIIFFISGGLMLIQSREIAEARLVFITGLTIGSILLILIIQVILARKALD